MGLIWEGWTKDRVKKVVLQAEASKCPVNIH